MLYLEDFLEKLELLPQEIRNQTSEIGKLDQQVQDLMDSIQNDLDELFENADSMHPDELLADFNTIMKVGEAALKQSDAKIQIADNMQKLISKYMNHLDIELQKCKKDLDFDKRGTTKGIEKKMEKILDNGKSFEEKLTVDSNCSDTDGLELEVDIVSTNSQMDPYPLSHTLEQMEAGSSGITAAASKIYVDSKKEIIGRTTRSSVSVASLPELPICQKLPQSGGSNKKTKKRTKNVEEEKNNDSIDMSIDKDKVELNERHYCLCNEVAYNTMIGCDNKKCPYEWFHYQCVGIESPPSGKWYCPKCILKLKKRRR